MLCGNATCTGTLNIFLDQKLWQSSLLDQFWPEMVIIWWWLSLIKLVNKIYQQKVCMYINHRYTIPFKRCLTWDNMITMFCFKIVWKTWPQRWFWLSRYGQRSRFVMKIFTELRYLIGIMNDTCTCTVVHLERNELCMCI